MSERDSVCIHVKWHDIMNIWDSFTHIWCLLVKFPSKTFIVCLKDSFTLIKCMRVKHSFKIYSVCIQIFLHTYCVWVSLILSRLLLYALKILVHTFNSCVLKISYIYIYIYIYEYIHR